MYPTPTVDNWDWNSSNTNFRQSEIGRISGFVLSIYSRNGMVALKVQNNEVTSFLHSCCFWVCVWNVNGLFLYSTEQLAKVNDFKHGSKCGCGVFLFWIHLDFYVRLPTRCQSSKIYLGLESGLALMPSDCLGFWSGQWFRQKEACPEMERSLY